MRQISCESSTFRISRGLWGEVLKCSTEHDIVECYSTWLLRICKGYTRDINKGYTNKGYKHRVLHFFSWNWL